MVISALTRLADRGDALEGRFKTLSHDPRSPEFASLVEDIRLWLGECVDQGRFVPPGSPDRRSLQGQVDYWTSRLQGIGHAVDDIDRLAQFDPKAGKILPDEAWPYHGLEAATGDPKKVFAGRDEQIEEYADHIDAHAALLIQSESGGGKSSVAMAGVVPELQRRHPDWLLIERITPGTQPADALRQAFVRLLALDQVDAQSVSAALAGRTVLVYVDQLEELLTMCTDVNQQREFSELLSTLAGPAEASTPGPLRLVATMRVDHYERLANSEFCRALYQLLTRDNSVKTLPPMSLAQIRQVILKPAERIGLRFVPPSIVDRLASETANAPSGLPLLQFALRRLWDERPRLDDKADGPPLDMITEASFAKLPTVSSALGQVAESYYLEMQAAGLVDACRRLMLELTVIDERLEVPLRRRRAEREVLDTVVAAGLASREQIQALVDGLVKRRLLVRSGEGESLQIEVAHEALFRYWGRFQDWIFDEGTRATLREMRQISRAALLWERAQRSPDHHLRGEPLRRALELLRGHWLEPLSVEFVRASEVAEEAERKRADEASRALAAVEAEQQRARAAESALAEAERERQRAEKDARRDRLWRNWLVGGGVVVTIAGVVSIAAMWRSLQDAEAARSANTISAAYVLPQVRAMDALDLALTMHSELRTPESLATLAHAIDATGQAVRVGDRKDGPAFFTPSGIATVQLVGDKTTPLTHAIVRPLGRGIDDMQPAVKVALALEPGEDLAGIDVGPADSDGKQLVVASYVGPVVSQRRLMSRLQVSRIDAKSGQVSSVQRIELSSNGRQVTTTSPISFDNSGHRFSLVASRLAPGENQVDEQVSLVLHWTLGGQPSIAVAGRGTGAATAVAFMQGSDGKSKVINGRDDGRVDCGGTDRLAEAAPDWSRVVQLKTNGASRFVALHKDNSISAGDCNTLRTRQVQGPGQVRPEQVALRADDDDKGINLSYSLRGRLVCQRLLGEDASERNCLGHGLFADAAVPAVNNKGQFQGFRILDSTAPLMSFWRVEDHVRGSTAGLPAAKLELSETRWPTVASSSNGQHRLAFRTSEDKGARVHRLSADGQSGAGINVSDPQWIAINDQGLALVLTSRRASNRHQLTAVDIQGGVIDSKPTFEDAACMKLSPDGSQLLVASDRWRALRVAVDSKSLSAGAQFGKPPHAVGDVVTACAVGNGPEGKVVLASDTGSIRLFDAETGWVPLSELVPFALDSAALDVSIDAGSRFVAVLSSRRAARCRNGKDGHLLRIWDLELKRSEYPVVSACIERELRAIGPLAQVNGRWQLPLFYVTGDGTEQRQFALRQTAFECLACSGTTKDKTVNDKIGGIARSLGAAEMEPTAIKSKYGIRIGR